MKIERSYKISIEVPFKECAKCKKLIIDPEIKCKNYEICNTFFKNLDLLSNFNSFFYDT